MHFKVDDIVNRMNLKDNMNKDNKKRKNNNNNNE